MTNNIKKDNFYLYDEIFKGLSGDHLYTSINDFTVTVGGGAPATGSKTLTLSGLPTGVTLSPQSILAGGNVQKIDAQGNVWNVPLTSIVVVSSSVTFVDFEGRFFSDDNILVVLAGMFSDQLSMFNITNPITGAATLTSIVDIYNGVVITLTASGTTQVLESPSVATPGKQFIVVNGANTGAWTIDIVYNSGSSTAVLSSGTSQQFIWDGAAWVTLSGLNASDITFTPYLTIGSTNVQAAVEELKDEVDQRVNIITADLTINVGSTSTYTNIVDAWYSLRNSYISDSAIVTLRLAGEVFAAVTSPITLHHPCGDRIIVEGEVFTITADITAYTAITTSSFSIKVAQAGFPSGITSGMTAWLEKVTGNDSFLGAHTINSISADGTDYIINCGIPYTRNYLTTTPTINGTVKFQKTVLQTSNCHGIIVRNGNKIRLLRNFTIRGNKTSNTNGLYVIDGGFIGVYELSPKSTVNVAETNLSVLNFASSGVYIDKMSYAQLYKSCANNNGGYGYSIQDNSMVFAANSIACNNNIAGGVVTSRANFQNSVFCNNTSYGVNALTYGSISLSGAKLNYNSQYGLYVPNDSNLTISISNTVTMIGNGYAPMYPKITKKNLFTNVTSNIGQSAEQPYRYVRLAATGNVTFSSIVPGFTIDGVVLGRGDTLLLPYQSDAVENGVYDLIATAVRSIDSNYVAMNISQRLIHISEGTFNKGKLFQNINDSSITIGTSSLTYEEKCFSTRAFNNDVNTGTETVDSFSDILSRGCRWDVSISNSTGTALRTCSISAAWDATNNIIDDSGEYGIVTIGSTADVVLSVDISGDNVRLLATVASDNWAVKCQRYLI